MHCSYFSIFGQRFPLQHPKISQDISKGQDALGVARKRKSLSPCCVQVNLLEKSLQEDS